MNNTSDRGPRSVVGEIILLVEDETFVRRVACAILESAGFIVLAARNAEEAFLMHEQSGHVDLLLTDIVLPGEDGRRLARRLSRINSSLQVLLVTGYSEQVARVESSEDQEHLLQKPFDAMTLQRVVRELLDRRQCVARCSGAGDCIQARLR